LSPASNFAQKGRAAYTLDILAQHQNFFFMCVKDCSVKRGAFTGVWDGMPSNAARSLPEQHWPRMAIKSKPEGLLVNRHHYKTFRLAEFRITFLTQNGMSSSMSEKFGAGLDAGRLLPAEAPLL
jgi:hypothetical protein